MIVKLISLQALSSLNTLIDSMRNDTKLSNYHIKYAEGPLALQFSNFTVAVQNKTLAHIDILTLPAGTYAVTGEKGCGKSCFFSKVRGLKDDGVRAEGNITFYTPDGIKPKVIMIPQTDYIPVDVTLLELIYYPQILPKDPEQLSEFYTTAINFLLEINFDGLLESDPNSFTKRLNNTENWASTLSGGQKKSILTLSAVLQLQQLQRPCLAVLDEIFTGLDEASIKHAQQFLKNHLPQPCILFVIDHHLKTNNYDAFYDAALDFNNHTISIKDLAGITSYEE